MNLVGEDFNLSGSEEPLFEWPLRRQRYVETRLNAILLSDTAARIICDKALNDLRTVAGLYPKAMSEETHRRTSEFASWLRGVVPNSVRT